MMSKRKNQDAVRVRCVGSIDAPEFRDAVEALRESATRAARSESPEVVVVAQSRPGQIGRPEIEAIRRRWPLAGIVALLGSWCEGEYRTGRPWTGVERFYWYEFPAWWRQQIALRDAGECPAWARPVGDVLRVARFSRLQLDQKRVRGPVVLHVANPTIAEALVEVVHSAGYATVLEFPNRRQSAIRGAAAGIWDGGQLDAREGGELSRFCRALSRDAAPVVAMLDFPRWDRYDAAREIGASAVLGKPWQNADLIATVDELVERRGDISRIEGRAA
jgi:hypothetical protein